MRAALGPVQVHCLQCGQVMYGRFPAGAGYPIDEHALPQVTVKCINATCNAYNREGRFTMQTVELEAVDS